MLDFLAYLIALIVAFTFHEYAHARVATWLGDPTAKIMGRLTLSPFSHIDPLGALSLLFFHFGWGKPVPYNPAHFLHPKRDAVFTALAGPGMNLLLALVCMLPFKYGASNVPFLGLLLGQLIGTNIGFALFNLLPIPPLDGSKLLLLFFSNTQLQHLRKYTNIPALVFLVIFGIELCFGIPIISPILNTLVSAIALFIYTIT